MIFLLSLSFSPSSLFSPCPRSLLGTSSLIHAAAMEGASFKDDEIKRIENAVASVQASAKEVSQAILDTGIHITKMPNPLPGVANELLDTISALKKYRDDPARGLKSLDQLRNEAAELKQKNEDKKRSLQRREEILRAKEEKQDSEEKSLVTREHELKIAAARQETLSSSLDRRLEDFDSQVEAHSVAVKAHHEQVGQDKARREALDKREATLRESKDRLDKWESRLSMQDKDQQVFRATLDGRDESITSAQKELEGRVQIVKADEANVRKLLVEKLQSFSSSMGLISPAVARASDALDNIQAKTTNVGNEMSSLTTKLKSLSLETTTTADTVSERNAAVGSLLSELDKVEAKVQKLGDRAQSAMATRAPQTSRAVPSLMKDSQSMRSLPQKAAEPSHETLAGATTPQMPIVVSQQKRKHDAAHSGFHKRHTSSQGQASHPDSASSETEEPLGASFGERLSNVVSRGEEQTRTQSEAVAEPTVVAPTQKARTTSKQASLAQRQLENIWSQLMFSQPNWAVEDQDRLRSDLQHYQAGDTAHRPLVVFGKISKSQARGEESCWVSASMRRKGNFEKHGNARACAYCEEHDRLCLRVEEAPPQSGKSYRVTLRPK